MACQNAETYRQPTVRAGGTPGAVRPLYASEAKQTLRLREDRGRAHRERVTSQGLQAPSHPYKLQRSICNTQTLETTQMSTSTGKDKPTEPFPAQDYLPLSNTKGGTSDTCSKDELQVIMLSSRRIQNNGKRAAIGRGESGAEKGSSVSISFMGSRGEREGGGKEREVAERPWRHPPG